MEKFFSSGDFGKVLAKEPLSKHTTFEIGGPCEVMLLPETEEQIQNSLKVIQENNLPYMVIGNGSNLLVSDKGLPLVVIKLLENFSKISVEEGLVIAQAGAQLSEVAKVAMEESYTGMEYLSGIPGNIGGAVTMNAGAYGGEMKDVVKSVRVLTQNLEIKNYSMEEMHFSYRHSRVQEENLIVLSVTFEMEKGNYDEIWALYRSLKARREEKQPLEYASAGSTFKRPPGHYAGKLIDDAGLRGYRHNDAMVSEKHCGFVINVGKASCDDVLYVIRHVRKEVYDKYHIELEPEVRILGEEI